ncbi:formate dehydrogenase accessory sulfurtransferase FdhD [uncultured Jannaschia sp.]|uniref:formate dehydrogenase accessory sulfurtransferase FdhD n=1 Tax=uncultured Jannaschia sp. TaxID=293347 RepID=UPI0026363EA0|nr:formate dehydrogenase accessory sulfurtransferase FdhD [uncultured Jannaschia sp.]
MKDHGTTFELDATVADRAPGRTRCDRFTRISTGADPREQLREVAVEVPVSIEVNGIGIAVMMATPDALDDFVVGFVRAEGLIDRAEQVAGIDRHRHPKGWIIRLRLDNLVSDRVVARARTRVTESACGLCGLENLEALAAPLPRISRPMRVAPSAIRTALDGIRAWQEIGRSTSATHAAALCDPSGEIVLLREDVGRHNALDKAIGAGMRTGLLFPELFALVTSRLSFELVEKAARADLGALVAMSAPTSLALDRAAEAGLPVIASARADGALASDAYAREASSSYRK